MGTVGESSNSLHIYKALDGTADCVCSNDPQVLRSGYVTHHDELLNHCPAPSLLTLLLV